MKIKADNETPVAYRSIMRAARILSCLSDGKNSVTEIAQSCELSKPTTSRLLTALEKSNLVIRDPIHRKYFLGYLLNRIVANPKTTHLNLVTIAVEEMNNLSKICGETVVLDILVGIRNIRLHMIPSIYNIRVYDENDDLSSLNVQGAAIKALLSQLDRAELASVMNFIRSKETGNTISEKNEILSQLQQIREQGYATSRGEIIAGALAISAPIKGYHLPAALTVLGFESRFEPRFADLKLEIVASANRISRNLNK